MFYVCYVVKARIYVVIPANWIKDHEKQVAKYINLGLNRFQELLAYYSQKQIDEINGGRSILEFAPNFELSTAVMFPADGCYKVIPSKCFGKKNLQKNSD